MGAQNQVGGAPGPQVGSLAAARPPGARALGIARVWCACVVCARAAVRGQGCAPILWHPCQPGAQPQVPEALVSRLLRLSSARPRPPPGGNPRHPSAPFAPACPSGESAGERRGRPRQGHGCRAQPRCGPGAGRPSCVTSPAFLCWAGSLGLALEGKRTPGLSWWCSSWANWSFPEEMPGCCILNAGVGGKPEAKLAVSERKEPRFGGDPGGGDRQFAP